jgi:hypothetical protein
MARPKTGLAELSHRLTKAARCGVIFSSPPQMHVRPLRLGVHINQEPPSVSTFPGTLEGSIDVFLSVVMTKRQSDPGEDNLLVSSRGIEVLE